MSTPPRRRRPAARREKPDGGGWLPTIAMGLGVVVAGLGIGVLVAVLTQRPSGNAPLAPLAVVTSTPEPSNGPATRRPIAIATFVPPRTPRPVPSPVSSPIQTVAATEEPTAAPRRVAAETPEPLTSGTSPAAASTKPPSAAPATSPGLEPASVAPGPDAVSPSRPSAGPATALPAAVSAASPSAYDEHASAVVRRYVDALIRGDEKTAYSALGSGGTLSEQAFLDPNARIISLKVTRIDASNASVGCEIESAKGHYYATYHVTAATGGPYISEHDYIKV